MTKQKEVYCDCCGNKLHSINKEHLTLGKYVKFRYKNDWLELDLCKKCKSGYLIELGAFNRKYALEHMTEKSIEEHNKRWC